MSLTLMIDKRAKRLVLVVPLYQEANQVIKSALSLRLFNVDVTVARAAIALSAHEDASVTDR